MAGFNSYNGRHQISRQQVDSPPPAIVVTRHFGSSIHRAQIVECSPVEINKTNIFFGGTGFESSSDRIVQSLIVKNTSHLNDVAIDLTVENTSNFRIQVDARCWVQSIQIFLDLGEERIIQLGFLPKDASGKLEKAKLLVCPHRSIQKVPPCEVQLSGYAGSSKIQVKVKQVELIDLLHKHYSLELENIGQLKSYAFVEFYRKDGVNISPFVDPPFLVIPVEDVGKVDIIFPVSSVSNDDGKRCFVQVYWGDEELRLRWKSCIAKGLGFTSGSNWYKFRKPSTNDWEENYADLVSSEDDMLLFYNDMVSQIIELPKANQVEAVDHPPRNRAGSFNSSLPKMTRADQLCLLNQPSLGSSGWLSKSTGSLPLVDSFRCKFEPYGCKKVFVQEVGAASHASANCSFSPKSKVPVRAFSRKPLF